MVPCHCIAVKRVLRFINQCSGSTPRVLPLRVRGRGQEICGICCARCALCLARHAGAGIVCAGQCVPAEVRLARSAYSLLHRPARIPNAYTPTAPATTFFGRCIHAHLTRATCPRVLDRVTIQGMLELVGQRLCNEPPIARREPTGVGEQEDTDQDGQECTWRPMPAQPNGSTEPHLQHKAMENGRILGRQHAKDPGDQWRKL